MRMTASVPRQDKIKETFKDEEGNDIKEYIYTFRDGDPAKFLVEFEKQLLTIGDRYNLFENGRWKVLCQIRGRALEGWCEKYWNDIIESIRNHRAGKASAQQKRFKKLIQKVNLKYLGREAKKDRCNVMKYGN